MGKISFKIGGKMTPKQHQKRHEELHHALDELLADWLSHSTSYKKGALLSKRKVKELMEWSYQQTINPVEKNDKEM
ncbi:unnamed protein product [marine sediment metagenome]|uniref:Uncharacterized protein n=1 Tax=marine sediment metagenome TaxID=412755 RepID=X1J1L0_9ZZZZ